MFQALLKRSFEVQYTEMHTSMLDLPTISSISALLGSPSVPVQMKMRDY